MKPNKFILALIALLTCSVQVLAETKTGNCGNDATYKFDTETGNLTISGTGAIDNSAFVIGKYDFCSNIKNVVIENGITEIGESAFQNCTEIVSITLPDGITSIANYAFCGTSITSINIPKSVTNIGVVYAINNPNLASITVDESNTKYDSRDNCNAIIETATNLLVYGCKSTIIPNGVAEINKYAFAKCGELTFINIPNSVTKINQGAFSCCSNLKSINISNKLTFIGGWAFDNCSSLISINIPSSVESINNYAFLSCSSLTSVVVEWDEPLDITSEVFYDVALSNVTLYVPEGKVNDYKNADVWKNFGKIEEVVKVTFSVNDEEFGSVEGESGNIAKGTTIDIKAVANEGYHFVKWNDGNTSPERKITVTENLVLTAEFAIDIFTITLSGDNGVFTGNGTCNYGTKVAISATPNAHYHFVKWSNGSLKANDTIVVVSDTALVAEFAIDTYNVELSAENGTVTGAGEYGYGSAAAIAATPAEGYHFVKWSNGSTKANDTILVVSDTALVAEFAIDTYNVELTAENGTVTGAGEYGYGSAAAIAATPAEGYHFVQWSNGSLKANDTIVVVSDTALVAEFAIDTLKVVLNAENGTVTGAGEYAYGTTVTIGATPAAGYVFVKWSDGNTDNPRTITVKADVELTAIFEPEKKSDEDAIDEDLAEEVAIYAYNNTIVVENAEEGIYVYDVTGRCIEMRESCPSVEIAMPREGIYIVRTGGKVQRVAVK